MDVDIEPKNEKQSNNGSENHTDDDEIGLKETTPKKIEINSPLEIAFNKKAKTPRYDLSKELENEKEVEKKQKEQFE